MLISFPGDFIEIYSPKVNISRDSLAIHQGIKIPRHIQHLSKILYYNEYIYCFQIFQEIIKETRDHINQKIKLLDIE